MVSFKKRRRRDFERAVIDGTESAGDFATGNDVGGVIKGGEAIYYTYETIKVKPTTRNVNGKRVKVSGYTKRQRVRKDKRR